MVLYYGLLLWSFTMVLYYAPLLCFNKCLEYQMYTLVMGGM